jgi:AraC-like DNA-binding protein
MKIYIKNMVCQGTKFFVLLEMEKLGIKFTRFELGEIELEEDLTLLEIRRLDYALRKYGLEVVFRKSKLVARIRTILHELLDQNIDLKSNFSPYVSKLAGYNYDYLNNYFTKETGMPIEEYFIEKRNEKLRENEPKWAEAVNELEKIA